MRRASPFVGVGALTKARFEEPHNRVVSRRASFLGLLLAALKALQSVIPPADIKTAQFPLKRADAFYSSSQWLKLLASIIAERGRICEDPQHAFNRSHRLKNALPPANSLGRIYGDHIVELADGGKPLDPSNVMLRCAVCHGRKTAAVGIARRNTRYKANPASDPQNPLRSNPLPTTTKS